MATDRLEAILDRLRLVEIGPLRRYEKTEAAKVDEIEESLRSTETLINPVVVDVERQLLIDGHHRVEAFEKLGLTRIPAFTVDYFSDDLTVEGWNHATNAKPEEIERVIDCVNGSGEGPWAVLTVDPEGQTLARREFENHWEAARYLNDLVLHLRENGHTVTLTTEAEALHEGLTHSYIKPVVGKGDVIKMVEAGRLFPSEINRHLIQNRPLGLYTPLACIGGESRFQKHIERTHESTTPLALEPGFRHIDRLYEERVILFHTPCTDS